MKGNPLTFTHEQIEAIRRVNRRLDDRRKIKYTVPPDAIRSDSPLLGADQQMVDASDLAVAVEATWLLLKAVKP